MKDYNKMSGLEKTALLSQQYVQINDLNKKNEKLEESQNAFMFELKAEISTFKNFNRVKRFFKAVALVWQIFATSEKYFNEG